MLRKAAAAWSSLGSPGHADLVTHIYSEKTVGEAQAKLISANKEASQTLSKWSAGEENATLRDLISRMTELDELSNRLLKDYADQYDSYRKMFKEILRGEKMVDDARKEVESQRSKVAKIAKQLEIVQIKRKGDTAKKDNLDSDYTKAISAHDEGLKELKMREENHSNFKYTKVREALYILARAGSSLHEQCSIISDAQEKLLQIYPKTMAKVTLDTFNKAQQEGTRTIDAVASQLQIERSPQTDSSPANQTASDTPPPKPKRIGDALVEATSPIAITLNQSKPMPTDDPYTYQPIPEREENNYDNNAATTGSLTSPPCGGATSTATLAADNSITQVALTEAKQSPNSGHRPLPPIPLPTGQTGSEAFSRQISDVDGNPYDCAYAELPVKTPPPRPPYSPLKKNAESAISEARTPRPDNNAGEQGQQTDDYLKLVSEDEDIREIVADYDTPDSILPRKAQEDHANISRAAGTGSKRRAAPALPLPTSAENKDTTTPSVPLPTSAENKDTAL